MQRWDEAIPSSRDPQRCDAMMKRRQTYEILVHARCRSPSDDSVLTKRDKPPTKVRRRNYHLREEGPVRLGAKATGTTAGLQVEEKVREASVDSLVSLLVQQMQGGNKEVSCFNNGPKEEKMSSKRVRFAFDDEGCVSTEPIDQQFTVAPVDREELWWSKDEMKSIRWECSNICSYYANNEHYVRILKGLYTYPSLNADLNENDQDVLRDADRTRGLEMDLLHRERRQLLFQHRAATLQATRDLPGDSGHIRQVSRSRSAQSAAYSLIQGKRDQNEAERIYSSR